MAAGGASRQPRPPRGRLKDCEALALAALAHRFEGHDVAAGQMLDVQMFFIRREQGRLDELVHAIQDIAEEFPLLVGWRCALAFCYAQLDRGPQARQELEVLAHADFCNLPRDGFWLLSLSMLCELVVLLGDAPRAHMLYKLLLPYADRCVVAFNLLCQGSASRPLGLLATTLSQYEDAERHFEQAVKVNAQIGSPLWSAHTQHDYARMLLARGEAGDNDKASQLLEHALVTADELGLQALADKARPLRLTAESAGSPPTFLPASPPDTAFR